MIMLTRTDNAGNYQTCLCKTRPAPARPRGAVVRTAIAHQAPAVARDISIAIREFEAIEYADSKSEGQLGKSSL